MVNTNQKTGIKPRVIVLGLDGASWNVLNPLISAGKLPTFATLLRDGSYGPLKSVIPPVSVPAWKCYSTGKNPGKLSAYGMLTLDLKKRKFSVPMSNYFKDKDIWDYLGEREYTSCVYNMFSTHPASQINGHLISDMPNERGFYPKELKEEIEGRFGSIYSEPKFTTDREKSYLGVLNDIRLNFDVLTYLIERFDHHFIHTSIARTDGIQHFFWRDMETKDPKFGKNIENFWIEIDRLLSNLLNLLKNKYGDNFYLFIISDHGFEGVNYRFNMGDWLVKHGYLKLNRTGKIIRTLFPFRKQVDFMFPLLDRLTDIVRKGSGDKQTRRGIRGLLLEALANESVYDWEKSSIIPLEGDCLYANNLKLTPSQIKNLVQKLTEEISGMKTPDGEPMVSEIYKGKELYGAESAPDIIILGRNVHIYNAPIVKLAWSKPSADKWTGKHGLYGVFIAYGADIKKGHKIENATIYDICPTILDRFSLAMPDDLDGKILDDIFQTSSVKQK